MADVDISAEAVERLAERIHEETNHGRLLRWCPPQIANDAAATLRALRAAVEAAAQKNAMRWREQYRQEMRR